MKQSRSAGSPRGGRSGGARSPRGGRNGRTSLPQSRNSGKTTRRHHTTQYQRASKRMRAVYRRRRIVVGTAALAVICFVVAVVAHVPGWLSGAGDAVSAAGHPSLSRTAASKPRALTAAERAVAALGKLDGNADVSTEGFTLSDDDRAALDQAVATVTSAGYGVSVTMVDMTTYRALAVHGGDARYSASAIKGPYILALAATGTVDLDAVAQSSDSDPTGVGADGKPVSSGDGDTTGATAAASGEDESAIASDMTLTSTGAGVNQLIAQTVTVSDNSSFAALHRTYGSGSFAAWATRAHVGADVTSGAYLDISSTDMARMWTMGYGYLFHGDATLAVRGSKPATSDAARQWLAGEFTDTLNSSIHNALGGSDGYAVYTKAGWIDDGDYKALNDAGIVTTGSGDYVIAVMTDAVGQYDLVAGLVSALDGIHSSAMAK
ncbi:serine hydrolase [Bifidobacterium parmae]|uniref:Autolysin n=1 Tax=Bifidobacterium parmae TaxID=361854 RepID=A0A2N5J4T0_9BIFI|nr:serine hydrolase [Bifidobacterium parmae]PLS29203.1 autolysin [Bifidobacterium parmae]